MSRFLSEHKNGKRLGKHCFPSFFPGKQTKQKPRENAFMGTKARANQWRDKPPDINGKLDFIQPTCSQIRGRLKTD